jgi:XrtN system VIT domain protein
LVPLSIQSFTFNQKTFKVESEETEDVEKQVVNVVLDLNSSWTKSEFEKILTKCPKQTFWYSPDQAHLVIIEPTKSDEIWGSMSKMKFNLMPYHKIDPTNSLLITKPTAETPSYKELDSSQYAKSLSKSVQQNNESILCMSIGESSNSVLYNTLNDFRYLNTKEISLEKCIEAIQSSHFLQNKVADNTINIDHADINITQTNDSSNAGAPDHLMRLFYAKKIQQQAGKYYFEASNSQNLKACVDMANEAFIVSPVSSLIVLETDKDYDDFGIDKNKNSLLNATKKGKGAVPEPHEWMMIGIGLLAMFYLMMKQRGIA